ncbi:MAG: DHH family phosphoesterase [Clostridiales Family XIII bacterium]|jgi:phosphoglycolate phosphatase|nr:DHH family phosphoesterase [Clostridiales Family XIII bacterium]
MKIKELAKYSRIAIQCHDIPDADAICSGFALQCCLRALGADVALLYGGAAKISKPSLLILLDRLNIEISHAEALPPETDLLITVDCQRGAGNVTNFEIPAGAAVVVIDHHRPEIPESENTIIRPALASCATLVWDLLRKEQLAMDDRVQTALYYGLFTDTNGLSELRHPLDRDLADIPNDAGLIRKLENSAITPEELDIIGEALRDREYIGNIGLFRARPCDPNLLGFTSDIARQVVNIDCCVVYCFQRHGIKLSVRSSAREIMSGEIAGFLCRDAGSGGGNIEKAGGFLSFDGIAKVSGGASPEEYLKTRIRAYLDNYDLIYADNNHIDFDAMPLYKKLPLPVGYAKSADIFPAGTKITVRTLEGDIDTLTGETVYLMIGMMGEVYPILRDKFESSYIARDEAYRRETEYAPALLNRVTGERKTISSAAKLCEPKDTKLVRAAALTKDTQVFSYWDTEKYFYGGKGDYLVANEGDYKDCYIVRQDIFAKSYELLD